MFKKKVVSFVINKRSAMLVIDTLSVYGSISVAVLKGGEKYHITIECEKENLQNCLDRLMEMGENKVWIRKVDVKSKI